MVMHTDALLVVYLFITRPVNHNQCCTTAAHYRLFILIPARPFFAVSRPYGALWRVPPGAVRTPHPLLAMSDTESVHSAVQRTTYNVQRSAYVMYI